MTRDAGNVEHIIRCFFELLEEVGLENVTLLILQHHDDTVAAAEALGILEIGLDKRVARREHFQKAGIHMKAGGKITQDHRQNSQQAQNGRAKAEDDIFDTLQGNLP